MVNGWYSLLNEAIDANAPLKRKRIRDDIKPKWSSPAILKLMKKRDNLLKKAKRSNTPDDWLALKSAKNKATEAIRTVQKTSSMNLLGKTRTSHRESRPRSRIFPVNKTLEV